MHIEDRLGNFALLRERLAQAEDKTALAQLEMMRMDALREFCELTISDKTFTLGNEKYDDVRRHSMSVEEKEQVIFLLGGEFIDVQTVTNDGYIEQSITVQRADIAANCIMLNVLAIIENATDGNGIPMLPLRYSFSVTDDVSNVFSGLIEKIPLLYPEVPIGKIEKSQDSCKSPPNPQGGHKPYVANDKTAQTKKKRRVTAGVLAILLGSFGAHKFYLGKIWMGVLYLVLNIVFLGFISFIAGIVEGILYLCSSDEKFEAKYVLKKKGDGDTSKANENLSIDPSNEEIESAIEAYYDLIKQNAEDGIKLVAVVKILQLLESATVILPATVKVSDSDLEQFLSAKKGDNISTKQDMRWKPDILLDSDKNPRLAVFTSKEQMPPEYSSQMSKLIMPFVDCCNMLENFDEVDTIVINPFSRAMLITPPLLSIIKRRHSSKACCIFSYPTAEEAGQSFKLDIVEEFSAADYTYNWNECTQRLVKCTSCGVLFLQKHYEFKAMSSEDKDYYHTYYFPVSDREEALMYSKQDGATFESNYKGIYIKKIDTGLPKWEWNK